MASGRLTVAVACLTLATALPTYAAPPAASPTSEPPPRTEAPLPEVVERVMQPWTGDLDGMVKRRMIRVLVTCSRASYSIDRGRQSGITYELFSEVDKYVNRGQKNPALQTEVVLIPVRRDQLLSYLIAGKGDIAAANLTITNARLEQVDFADPVLTGVSEIVVTGPTASPPAGLDDLAGREIVVRRSSSYFESLSALNDRFRSSGRPPMVLTPANENLEDEDLLEMVGAGLLPATVVDSHVAGLWSQVYEGIKVHDTLAVRTGGQIAWAIRKDSPQFKNSLNVFVRDHRKGTAFGNIVFNRYLKTPQKICNAVSQEDARRFQATVEIIRKYASEYDFDWLLVAAQAYQESRLDQSLRSPAGAVGIMQVLPKTAAAPPIGIRNVERLENNVQAGTAYLRHIRDQYFRDPEMDAFNQQLFSFAAYNAGPARVNGLRRKAKAMGLDPNRWFQNVEMVAAREIGRETVDYVANILKYYVAYDRYVTQAGLRAGSMENE